MARRKDSVNKFAQIFIKTIGYERSIFLIKEFAGKQIRITADYNLNSKLSKALDNVYLSKILFEKFGDVRVSVPTLESIQEWKRDNLSFSEEDAADLLTYKRELNAD